MGHPYIESNMKPVNNLRGKVLEHPSLAWVADIFIYEFGECGEDKIMIE